MSFSLTTRQYRDRTKTVTRRFGWWFLKPGDVFEGAEKTMGLKKGEQVVRLGPARVVSTRQEPINAITPEDVVREGFPGMTPAEFVDMLCRHSGKCPEDICNRIEFEHVREEEKA